MSQNQNDGFDPADPFGVWRSYRDANLDAWSKGMATLVNSESFAKAIGLQLDSYLAASAPFQKAINQYMDAYLAQLGMPSRAEVISLAQRMTAIEMRLDDLDDRFYRIEHLLQQIHSALEARPAPAALPAVAEPAPALPEANGRARRSRKAADEIKQEGQA
jgi:hypothetical protein